MRHTLLQAGIVTPYTADVGVAYCIFLYSTKKVMQSCITQSVAVSSVDSHRL